MNTQLVWNMIGLFAQVGHKFNMRFGWLNMMTSVSKMSRFVYTDMFSDLKGLKNETSRKKKERKFNQCIRIN